MHTPPQARDDKSNFKFSGVPPAPSALYHVDRMKLQFHFRLDRPFFWPAAGLTPETYNLRPYIKYSFICLPCIFCFSRIKITLSALYVSACPMKSLLHLFHRGGELLH
jgi:hypothetical protein